MGGAGNGAKAVGGPGSQCRACSSSLLSRKARRGSKRRAGQAPSRAVRAQWQLLVSSSHTGGSILHVYVCNASRGCVSSSKNEVKTQALIAVLRCRGDAHLSRQGPHA